MAQLTNILGNELVLFFQLEFPTKADGTWNPFQLFDCDVSGGTLDDIAVGDSVTAFLLGRLPFKVMAKLKLSYTSVVK